METTRNRSRVLAQFLRGSVSDLRLFSQPRDDVGAAALMHENAVDTIAAVADALEQAAAQPLPDPAGATR